MKSLPHPTRDRLRIEAVLYALSDPLRLSIVRTIASAGDALSCGGSGCPAMAKSTLAHHFRVLRASGVLASERKGNYVYNSLRRADLDARFPGLFDAILSAGESRRTQRQGAGKATGKPDSAEKPAARKRVAR